MKFLQILTTVGCFLLLSTTPTYGTKSTKPVKNKMSQYLFAYFTGNSPKEEQIHFAISKDGYNYIPLNNGNPIISSDTISIKKGVRDPHILRGEDGKFYMVVTDMRSHEGWSSNRGIVLMKSDDLVNWTHSTVHFPTRFADKWKNVTRVWAPQTIWDRQAKRYMVYFSLLTDDGKLPYDKVFYCYANKDFTDLETEPEYLFDRGSATIDSDIIYNEATKRYHYFFKNEGEKGICQVTAKTLTPAKGKAPGSQWSAPSAPVQQTNEAVEGGGIFKTIDGKGWILMYDCYMNGHYQFCSSSDLKTFKFEKNTSTSGKFTPRHGTTITITDEEAERLIKKWPSEQLSVKRLPECNNPIIEDFRADPEILYSKKTGKFYLYPTTDGYAGWGGYSFNVYSSDNLVDWKDEGTIINLKSNQVVWANGNAWAPCIEEKQQADGSYKYYFYYSGNTVKGKQTGVAVADHPTGPFKDSGRSIVALSPTGRGQQIDSDVFTDPVSGKSYLYWGNGYMAGAELNDDMLTIKEKTIKILTPKGGTLNDYQFREGAYVFYRNGLYYFLWSVDDTGSPNYHVAYGTSKNPMGPIEVAKEPVILKQDPSNNIYGTAHNSVIQIPGKDEWYIVYHRINKDFLKNGPGYHREVCIDKLEFNQDGTIVPVKPTQKGIQPVILNK